MQVCGTRLNMAVVYSYLEPNEIRIRVSGNGTLDVERAADCQTYLSRLTERLVGETQSLDQ